jgi:hypothetical protein
MAALMVLQSVYLLQYQMASRDVGSECEGLEADVGFHGERKKKEKLKKKQYIEIIFMLAATPFSSVLFFTTLWHPIEGEDAAGPEMH